MSGGGAREAKAWLSWPYELSRRIEAGKARAERLRAEAELAAPRLEAAPSRGNGMRGNRAEEAAVRLISLEEEIARGEEELAAALREAGHAIAGVPYPLGRRVLEARYLRFMGWEDAARSLGVSMRTALRAHRRALELLGAP